MMKSLFYKINVVFAFTLFLLGCKSGPDVSSIKIDLKVTPFYKELHAINPDSLHLKLDDLKRDYTNFLEPYSIKVIKVGSFNSPEYLENLKSFIEYEPNVEVFEKCNEVFGNFAPIQKELEDAYRHYVYYFPSSKVPDIYLHISGFNQSMIADSGLVSISVEKYLGSDCDFYERLAFPNYLRRKMTPEKIAPDLMRATAYIDFPFDDSVDDVCNNIVYQGKALWFVKHMMPEINDTLLFDFTNKEMEWSRSHEAEMWSSMVEDKHVFSNDRLMIQKYVGDAPFTYYFGQESPGRTGTYIGYKIIESYMNSHPEVSLSDLMNERDGHLIMNQSGYRP